MYTHTHTHTHAADSPLPAQLAELLTLADEREGRAAQAVVAAALDLERDPSHQALTNPMDGVSMSVNGAMHSLCDAREFEAKSGRAREIATEREREAETARSRLSSTSPPLPSAVCKLAANSGAADTEIAAQHTQHDAPLLQHAATHCSTLQHALLPQHGALQRASTADADSTARTSETNKMACASSLRAPPPSSRAQSASSVESAKARTAAEAAEKGVVANIAASAAARRQLARATERAQASCVYSYEYIHICICMYTYVASYVYEYELCIYICIYTSVSF